jgi:hypothetical protein
MNKTDALARLAALETETAALRRIIEEPEKLPGLWMPVGAVNFYCVKGDGRITWYDSISTNTLADYASSGNVFPSCAIAEKASPLMARANKIIAAALQADPDAGEWAPDRKFTALLYQGQWDDGVVTAETIRDTRLVCVHTQEQCMAMAAILNAEGVK